MDLLLIGLAIFFLPHFFTMLRAPRTALAQRLGEGGYKGAYSLVSAIGLALAIWGFARYRSGEFAPLYAPLGFARHVGPLMILVAFILIAGANMPAGYIKSAVRHPFLAGIALWALAHLAMNGDLGGAILFGAFLAYVAIDAAALIGRAAPARVAPDWRYDVRAIVGGVAAFLVFALVIHPYVLRIAIAG